MSYPHTAKPHLIRKMAKEKGWIGKKKRATGLWLFENMQCAPRGPVKDLNDDEAWEWLCSKNEYPTQF